MECDSVTNPNYNEQWVENAIPFVNMKPSRCQRFERNTTDTGQDFCSKDSFITSSIMRCEQDGLIYSTDEVSILNEVFKPTFFILILESQNYWHEKTDKILNPFASST